MKPKVKSFGFTDEELMTVCESIANGLASNENVTDDDINSRIDAMIPFFKMSQSASNRSFERMKKQFEEDQKKKNPDPDPNKKDEKDDPSKLFNEMMDKFKSDFEKKLAEQQAIIDGMTKSKANEGFLARAKKNLEKVDPKYYQFMLEGKEFASESEVDDFTKKISDNWESFCKDRNIEALSHMTPPGGSKPAPTEASAEVKERIAQREKAGATTNTVVKGLPTAK